MQTACSMIIGYGNSSRIVIKYRRANFEAIALFMNFSLLILPWLIVDYGNNIIQSFIRSQLIVFDRILS